MVVRAIIVGLLAAILFSISSVRAEAPDDQQRCSGTAGDEYRADVAVGPERIEVSLEMPLWLDDRQMFPPGDSTTSFATSRISFRKGWMVIRTSSADLELLPGMFAGIEFQLVPPESIMVRMSKDDYEGARSLVESLNHPPPPPMPELPAGQLAPPLRNLPRQVLERHDGNLDLGTFKVVDKRVEVRIRMTAVSRQALEELTRLGLEVTAQIPGANSVVGFVSVDCLDGLLECPAVQWIEPQQR